MNLIYWLLNHIQTPTANSTPEQLAAVKALMEELHKKTTEAAEAAAKLPQGMVSDTVKLG